ncbi:MAG: hypothetical protein R2932_50620 [Caldilineaceae bacterium]
MAKFITIWNWADLCARGVQFQGDSDSEVLLQLLIREGAATFLRLNGILPLYPF